MQSRRTKRLPSSSKNSLRDRRFIFIKGEPMDTWTFGWTLALIGMGGTMLVLWCVSLFILLLKKIFPYKPEETAPKKGA
jgi:hypothetical protein